MATNAMTAMAPATGPLSDWCNLVQGGSQGSAWPPWAPRAVLLKIKATTVRSKKCAFSFRQSTFLNAFICVFLPWKIYKQKPFASPTSGHETLPIPTQASLHVFQFVPTVPVAQNHGNFTYFSTGFDRGFVIHEDDHVHSFGDQLLL